MPTNLLYSTNPVIKLHIQKQFRGDRHYVWCSEHCDNGAQSRYSFASLVPPSSNPKSIYEDLRNAVQKGDRHNEKIVATRARYLALATDWHGSGQITTEARDEIVYFVTNAELALWRPVLYVIPRDPLGARCKPVAPSKRASHGPEFIIEDLAGDEFDVVEL